MRQRFEGFAAAFAERARPKSGRGAAPPGQGLREDYWLELRELLTRDVTPKDLQDLLARDAQESVRFFVREVDFEALRARPWHRRYPRTVWRIFLAMAYRLSPARRALFAAGGLLLIAGWARYFATALFFEGWPSTGSALRSGSFRRFVRLRRPAAGGSRWAGQRSALQRHAPSVAGRPALRGLCRSPR